MELNTQEKYEAVQGLPPFAEFEKEFELIDATKRVKFIPSQFEKWVRHVMVDKYFGVINYLYTFVVPNQQSIIYMNEYNYISEESRKDVIEIVRLLMLEARKSNHLDFDATPAQNVAYVCESLKVWQSLKPRIEKISAENIEGWKKPSTFDGE